MKKLLAFLSPFLLLVSAAAQVPFSINITVDEQGHGLLTNTNGVSDALPASVALDPTPGGGTTLTYGLLNPPGLTAGDLFLVEAGSNSDLIRFNPSENGGSLVFYSSDNTGALADNPFPSSFLPNTFSLSEGSGTVDYTPIAGEPGFVSGAAGPVTYTITSSPPVPEPSSLILLGTGIVSMLGMARRRLFA